MVFSTTTTVCLWTSPCRWYTEYRQISLWWHNARIWQLHFTRWCSSFDEADSMRSGYFP